MLFVICISTAHRSLITDYVFISVRKRLATEIDFDESVLELIKQECQAKMSKCVFEQEVYLKDSELSCLNDVLPAYYLAFTQDVYGAHNYGGHLLVEGLSAIVPPHVDYRQIFFKLKQLLTARGYIIVCDRQFGLVAKEYGLKQFLFRLANHLIKINLKIIVFKGEESLDIIKIYQTNGWNYNVSPRDIINRLKSWQEVCKFEIIFASHSSLNIVFVELPKDLINFAKDVCNFCPDVQNHQAVIKEIETNDSLYLSWH